MPMNFKTALIFLILVFPLCANANTFNKLVLLKAEIEKRYGIQTLECFPFLEKIGTNEDEAEWVSRCYQGVQTLSQALNKTPNSKLQTVGISTRFLRTGGFHTLLVPWNAPQDEMIQEIKSNLTEQQQKEFLEKIFSHKEKIHSQLTIRQLYCSQKISNEQCLKGYQTLSSILPDPVLQNKQWSAIVISNTHFSEKDPTILTLPYDDEVMQMTHRLVSSDTEKQWNDRKKMYEKIQEKFGKSFDTLQLSNYFCAVSLTVEECYEGAENIFKASSQEILRDKTWGKVFVNRFNTLIKNDYDLVMRYDMSPEEIIKVASRKLDKQAIEANVTKAERLESISKNNSARLRAVCDLQDLPSTLCLNGFQNFISFLREYRNYRVRFPWTDLMFVDGNQLSRVNFALNSKVRQTYIYIDANSDMSELKRHLFHFKENEKAKPLNKESP